LTDTNAGYWDYQEPLETVVPSPLPTLGQRIWFQVRISELVNYFPFPEAIDVGASPVYSMVVTNYVMPMVGLESFKLEPERLEISAEGDQAIIRWQYLAASQYELRSTRDLKPPVSWAPIFEWSVEVSGWPGRFHIFSVTNVMTDVPQFFRLERGRHTTD
jgi:hypothetical protein